MCSKCIMDTTDPEITFNDDGICSHCINFETVIKPLWRPEENRKNEFAQIVDTVKSNAKNPDYDSVMGLSGGVDSSYMAYVAVKEFGLRPLVIHVDCGWNSELAVKNIENIVKILDLDLYTYVVNWEEMKDLSIAFFKSAVTNQDIPQDHAFAATLFKTAADNNINAILSGSNFATESILPTAWGYDSLDKKHLKGIHCKFGEMKLKTYPTISFLEYYFYYPYIRKIRIIKPLNYVPYIKEEAMTILKSQLNWRDYGGKHCESRYTKFFQRYYLPEKFGYDKRKAHLSSLIVSGQIEKSEALEEMGKPLYEPSELQEDIEFICKKNGFSEEEFDRILNLPNKTFRDYPSNYRFKKLISFAKRVLLK